jgi:hypothetical protein
MTPLSWLPGTGAALLCAAAWWRALSGEASSFAVYAVCDARHDRYPSSDIAKFAPVSYEAAFHLGTAAGFCDSSDSGPEAASRCASALSYVKNRWDALVDGDFPLKTSFQYLAVAADQKTTFLGRAASSLSLRSVLFFIGALGFSAAILPLAWLVGQRLDNVFKMFGRFASLARSIARALHWSGAIALGSWFVLVCILLSDGCAHRTETKRLGAVFVSVVFLSWLAYAESVASSGNIWQIVVRGEAALTTAIAVTHGGQFMGLLATAAFICAVSLPLGPRPSQGYPIVETTYAATALLLAAWIVAQNSGPPAFKAFSDPFTLGILLLDVHVLNCAALLLALFWKGEWIFYQGLCLCTFCTELAIGALQPPESLYRTGTAYTVIFVVKLLTDVPWGNASFVLLMITASASLMAVVAWDLPIPSL